MNKTILAIDPGKTTGYTLCSGSISDTYQWIKISKIDEGVLVYPNLYELSQMIPKTDVIIIEDYIIRQPHIGQRGIPIKIIGVVEYICNNIDKPLIFQQPGEKSLCTDGRLKALEVYNKNPHINDAYRHAFVYLFKELR